MIDSEMLQEYLNNHIAGSETALELLGRRLDEQPDPTLETLKDDIGEDRGVVEALMRDFQLSESSVKQALGWIGAKVARVKSEFDSLRDFALKDLLEYEILQVGIYGKRGLWTALRSLQDSDERLAALPLEDLIARADAQMETVESLRIAAARDALLTTEG